MTFEEIFKNWALEQKVEWALGPNICNLSNQMRSIIVDLKNENARLKTENAELIERAKWNAREQRKHNDRMREEKELLLKIVRHLKYKRCLAMAEWCDAEADVADADGDYEDMRWYQKWHERWTELADKFKE